jgi:hypothetical protein
VRQATSNGHEILWDGKTVWANSGFDGASIGRFCIRGVDVHKTSQEQVDTGKQCLDCSSDGSALGWSQFLTGMLRHHGVAIPDEEMPEYLRVCVEPVCESSGSR